MCQSDYSAALTDIGATLFSVISPCLEGALDTRDIDPDNPGVALRRSGTDSLVKRREVPFDVGKTALGGLTIADLGE